MNRQQLKRYMVDMRRGYREYWSKAKKGAYIDKIIAATGCNRKVVIRNLNREDAAGKKLGAPKKLTQADIELVKEIWKHAGYICAQYLVAELPAWLDDYEKLLKHPIARAQRTRLEEVSYKTIERELTRYRISKQVSNESTGVKAAIKAGIGLVEPIRMVCEPGHICLDTVAHCGSTTQGDFIWTLTWTDVYTGFTLNVAVWNKGYAGIEQALLYCIRHTPFSIIDINTDNGTEFLNNQLFRFWKTHLEGVKITRSRPAHKNDNAHAEQKNRTHVRDLFLRFRLEKTEYLTPMNRIYRKAGLFRNYVTPCKILREREWNAATHRYKKKYDDPMTPVERILKWAAEAKEGEVRLPQETQAALRKSQSKINRLLLSGQLDNELERFFTMLKDDPAANT